MPITCSFCKKTDKKGVYRYPTEESRRAEWLRIGDLPPESELKVKISGLRVCFRHFKADDFYFAGSQVRLRRGEFLSEKVLMIHTLPQHEPYELSSSP